MTRSKMVRSAAPAALAALALLVAGNAAARRTDGPRVRAGTPYPDARRALATQGFDPVRILVRENGRNGPGCQDDLQLCQRFPEMQSCSTDAPVGCAFLFRRRADGGYWLIFTTGQPFSDAPAEFRRIRYAAAQPASARDLDGMTIALPGGRQKVFRTPSPPTARPEARAPLCSEVPPHTLPCWVAPPGDARAAPKTPPR